MEKLTVKPMHKLPLTNGEASMLGSVLSIIETFTSPAEILRAGAVFEKVEITPPEDQSIIVSWLADSFGAIEISEAQREVCKIALNKHAGKMPPGAKHVCSLLRKFGFEE